MTIKSAEALSFLTSSIHKSLSVSAWKYLTLLLLLLKPHFFHISGIAFKIDNNGINPEYKITNEADSE
ncbi:hypothetical protein PNOK_0696600 [Pyrrhoderma noxium]|uniref:Uncharacterized protein n=1 Tax=Pyrrhoderma noxium TaxID=2282107 RepID=A0A286UBD2_9AGAM|nr:hypothetical protein PNOK_0696600 [Pyrrhoderma noxium]